MAIIPVIMCGGEGARLWPLSTPEKPKPFVPIFTYQGTLFEQALERVTSPGFGAP
jgi:Mannose-1-phosphate guanylyltransferase